MSMESAATSSDDGMLLRIDRLYRGAKVGDVRFPGPASCSWSLQSLARDLGVSLQPHRAQVVMAVVGDVSSGKTCFVNALVEALALLSEPASTSALPAQWQVPEEVNEGDWPQLLHQAAAQFPDWVHRAAAIVKSCRKVPTLRGIEVVEVAGSLSAQDLEPMTWIASRADIVVCMLDSQAKQPSEELLQLLKTISGATDPPELQFVFSRADLLRRESDRIQHIAKASRLLQEKLGRRFEILPVATGELAVILDVLDASSEGETQATCKWDAGRRRALQSAEDLLRKRAACRLDLLTSDCQALRGALDAQKSVAVQSPAQAGYSGNQLLLCGIGFALATAVVPFVLDEEQDESMVPIFMACTMVLACLCLFMAFCQSKQPQAAPGESPANCGAMLFKEQERFLSLVEKQCEVWRKVRS